VMMFAVAVVKCWRRCVVCCSLVRRQRLSCCWSSMKMFVETTLKMYVSHCPQPCYWYSVCH